MDPLAVVAALLHAFFDVAMCFPGLYHKGDFIGQSPSSVTVVYLHNRDLIGRGIRRCLKILTFLNFSMSL